MLALVEVCHANVEAKGRLCACLKPRALGRLRAIAADSRLEVGDKIFGPGDRADHVYGLRQGAVMLQTHLTDGRRQVLSFLFPGDTFGFADSAHHCEAIALTRSSLCEIPVSALNDDPLLVNRLRHISRTWLVDTHDQTLRLGRMRAAERVTDFLSALWTRLGSPDALPLPMRWIDIADHLGLRIETVSREFSALRRLGIIGPLSHDCVLPIRDGAALIRLAPPRPPRAAANCHGGELADAS